MLVPLCVGERNVEGMYMEKDVDDACYKFAEEPVDEDSEKDMFAGLDD